MIHIYTPEGLQRVIILLPVVFFAVWIYNSYRMKKYGIPKDIPVKTSKKSTAQLFIIAIAIVAITIFVAITLK